MPGGGAIIGGPLIGVCAGAPLVGAMAAGEGPPTPLTGPCKPINIIQKNILSCRGGMGIKFRPGNYIFYQDIS